jgi:uncharacterized protein
MRSALPYGLTPASAHYNLVPMTEVPDRAIERLGDWFDAQATTTVACSGGIDSLLLAHVASARCGPRVRVVHAVSPAVPPEGTARVLEEGRLHGWQVELVRTGEFDDERYLANPVDRCFHCKSHLYSLLDALECQGEASRGCVVSGANLDDLGEYRPGLRAAEAHAVRHPYVELGIGKATIRAMARALQRPYAELPASPCLASRLYTGTRVTPQRLRFVHRAEQLVRESTGCEVVRCRLDGDTMCVELPAGQGHLVGEPELAALRRLAASELPELAAVVLDARPYAPGRAFVTVAA